MWKEEVKNNNSISQKIQVTLRAFFDEFQIIQYKKCSDVTA